MFYKNLFLFFWFKGGGGRFALLWIRHWQRTSCFSKLLFSVLIVRTQYLRMPSPYPRQHVALTRSESAWAVVEVQCPGASAGPCLPVSSAVIIIPRPPPSHHRPPPLIVPIISIDVRRERLNVRPPPPHRTHRDIDLVSHHYHNYWRLLQTGSRGAFRFIQIKYFIKQ